MDICTKIPVSVLVVDDDAVFRRRLSASIRAHGYKTFDAAGIGEALNIAELQRPGVAVVDLCIGEESGLQLLSRLREMLPECRIIILTGFGTISTAVEAIRTGAAHYLTKPVKIEALLEIIADVSASRREGAEVEDGTAVAAMQADVPSLAQVEWEHIQTVLRHFGGNISKAAEALGMHRRSLQRKLGKDPGQLK
ncbi:MAG: response regulator [bacterium]|nr:response regulator [bacterium]